MLGKAKPHYVGGKLVKKTTGDAISVTLDWQWALNREEKKGDVIGFWHTHPSGNLEPSKRDIKTMQAWISCFGKPLLCVIQNSSHETAYRVSSVSYEKSQYAWSRGALVYKAFRHFGVFT